MRHCSQKIHLVGIGGAGMCGIAELLHAYGHTVTGSDRASSPVTQRLERLGIKVQYGHTPDLVRGCTVLIYSSAIKEDNPERVFARECQILQIRRAEALGQLMRSFTTICISGTHGKTTTTSLVGAVLVEAGLDPTILVGGTMLESGAPVAIGKSGLMVAESDEYDRSFLAMYPTLAIITNVEADHLDCYKDLDAIKDAFVKFTHRVPFYGAVIACIDDKGVRDLLPRIERTCITYGIQREADYTAQDVTFGDGKATFSVFHKGHRLGSITLTVPGMHNVANALAAVVAGRENDVPFDRIAAALGKFCGVKRRFEVIGRIRGVTLIDDYAHHPGEIAATLDAARRSGFKRIIAVFQPHLYSRTRDFMDDFALSLSVADKVIVTDIYKAREEPIPGVTSAAIIQKMRDKGHQGAQYVAHKDELPKALASQVIEGDAVIVMGAGDIGSVAYDIAEVLRHGK